MGREFALQIPQLYKNLDELWVVARRTDRLKSLKEQVPAIQAVIAQSEFGKLQRVGNSYWDACTAFGDTMAAGNPSGQDLQEIMDTLVDGIAASAAK